MSELKRRGVVRARGTSEEGGRRPLGAAEASGGGREQVR
ncbi:UNVERIFIED_ORG: hypothetical protein CLV66_104136 [Actinomadura viridilutea]